jgi:molybdopterin converting factor small subunit
MIRTGAELDRKGVPERRADGEPPYKGAGPAASATFVDYGALLMAIEVRIPTILRTYTDGAKMVEGAGSTLGEVIDDLDDRHSGLRGRLVADGGLRRFVNVYLNDEDVRFLGGLETPVKDGDTVTVLPAVAGGAG